MRYELPYALDENGERVPISVLRRLRAIEARLEALEAEAFTEPLLSDAEALMGGVIDTRVHGPIR